MVVPCQRFAEYGALRCGQLDGGTRELGLPERVEEQGGGRDGARYACGLPESVVERTDLGLRDRERFAIGEREPD